MPHVITYMCVLRHHHQPRVTTCLYVCITSSYQPRVITCLYVCITSSVPAPRYHVSLCVYYVIPLLVRVFSAVHQHTGRPSSADRHLCGVHRYPETIPAEGDRQGDREAATGLARLLRHQRIPNRRSRQQQLSTQPGIQPVYHEDQLADKSTPAELRSPRSGEQDGQSVWFSGSLRFPRR